MKNSTILFTNHHLPDSITDLLVLQKNIIQELRLRNKFYLVADGEVTFLKRQNFFLKGQINQLNAMMDRLCSDRHTDMDSPVLGLA